MSQTTTEVMKTGKAGTKKSTKKSVKNRFVRHLRRVNELPLATRLMTILLALLAMGLVIAAVATNSLVWGYLVNQEDEQLIRQAQLVVSNITSLSAQSSAAPTDYFVQIRDENGKILATPLLPRQKGGMVSQPILPAEGTKPSQTTLNVPFTTQGKLVERGSGPGGKNPGKWRVVGLRWTSTSGKTGTLYIGLSLVNATDTILMSLRYFLVICILVFTLAAMLGWLLIRRSLKPLRDIEQTASKIAAGDLSQRVPVLPETTEVGSLSASLNMMLNRIEQSFHDEEKTNAKMRRFVSDASHELRTPLAAISGYGELYEMQKASADDPLAPADTLFAKVRSSTARMTRLVNDLLSLARLDEGRGQHISENVELDDLLGGSCEDLHALDFHRPISLGCLDFSTQAHKKVTAKVGEVPFELGAFEKMRLACDADQLRRVFTNVVGNIHRYTPDDSPTEVSLTCVQADMSPEEAQKCEPTAQSWEAFVRAIRTSAQTGTGQQYAVIRFTDHGPGVRPEALTRLCDRFYTADPSRAREKGGTGLGMALALSVVKSQSGFIVASETPGGGLTQTIVLPLFHHVSEVISRHQRNE